MKAKQNATLPPRPKPPISRTLTILENAATIELSSSRHIVLRNRSRSAG